MTRGVKMIHANRKQAALFQLRRAFNAPAHTAKILHCTAQGLATEFMANAETPEKRSRIQKWATATLGEASIPLSSSQTYMDETLRNELHKLNHPHKDGSPSLIRDVLSNNRNELSHAGIEQFIAFAGIGRRYEVKSLVPAALDAYMAKDYDGQEQNFEDLADTLLCQTKLPARADCPHDMERQIFRDFIDKYADSLTDQMYQTCLTQCRDKSESELYDHVAKKQAQRKVPEQARRTVPASNPTPG